jgi:hypothetical protein
MNWRCIPCRAFLLLGAKPEKYSPVAPRREHSLRRSILEGLERRISGLQSKEEKRKS